MAQKKFKVRSIRSNHGRPDSESVFEGTIHELVHDVFGYTLECGKSWEEEEGNSKINRFPKGIKSLVKNLNNATNNSAANGYSNTRYEQIEA